MKMSICRITILIAVLMLASNAFAAQDQLPKKYTETIEDENGAKLTLEMTLIPGGTFLMGSPDAEPGRADNEGPQHKVKLDPFYLCTTETTIDFFMAYYQETATAKRTHFGDEPQEEPEEDVDAITGPTPVYGDLTMGYSEKNPAIGGSWKNAATFCRWLSKKTGKKYRLPTEAEWEYAARAGSKTAYAFGDEPDKAKLAPVAWYKANSGHEPHEVGKTKPNAWGLYDMAGNVREWVQDFYSPTAYKDDAKNEITVNPKGPKTGELHVVKGGDYSCDPRELRPAARSFKQKWWQDGDPQIPKSVWWLPEIDLVGFRIARSIEPDQK
ncbi:MAG: SUMF1/EgtB/PvdO family nonheme iron enzyme [Sedimentisphaerales bacterium]|nr:SUMF1/EgtB/PvdO family nonheme iron enzyme [Sedimentisphaerales bacterium]